MAFRVEVSAQAERDANAILQWLMLQHAGDTGMQWFVALEEAIGSLATQPQRCPVAPENARSAMEVRQLLYGRKPHVYRILFTVTGENRLRPSYSTRPPAALDRAVIVSAPSASALGKSDPLGLGKSDPGGEQH